MKLWSAQRVQALATLDAGHALVGNWSRVRRDRSWSSAYGWMSRQMVHRRVSERGLPPLWCWLKKDSARFNPDGWEPGWYAVLELEIPDEKVLVSSYDLWHFVLNGTPIKGFDEEVPESVERSWLKIFGPWDPSFLEYHLGYQDHVLQATVETVEPSMLVDAELMKI